MGTEPLAVASGLFWSAVASSARHRFGFEDASQPTLSQSAVAASLCRRTPNAFMTTIDKQRAADLLGRIGDCNIVVLGDVMLDEFIWGDVTRISPEAPVPVVDIRRESVHLGGAANVLANLVALGAQATVIGVIGDDSGGERLRSALLRESRVQSDDLIVDDARPSTIKTRIIAHSQLVVRADRELRTPVNGDTEKRILSKLKEAVMHAD